MGGRRPRLGGREWSGWPHVRHAVLYAAAGGSLTLATVVVGLLNLVSPQRVIALAVLATLATAGGMIGLVIPDAWAAWRRGFQQGFRQAMNRQAQRTQSNYRARRTRRSVAGDRPEPAAGDRSEPAAGDRPEPAAGDRPEPAAGTGLSRPRGTGLSRPQMTSQSRSRGTGQSPSRAAMHQATASTSWSRCVLAAASRLWASRREIDSGF